SDRGWVVGSYLFDHSDVDLAPALGTLFQKSIAAVDANEVLFTGGASKEGVARAVISGLTDNGWSEHPVRALAEVWSGSLDLVHEHRQAVYSAIDRARRWSAPPTWRSSSDRPQFHRLRFDGPAQLFA